MFSGCTNIYFVRFSGVLVPLVVLRKGCLFNPIWRSLSLGGPSEFIGFIFNPLKSIILIFKGFFPHNACHFPSWFVRYTWSHSERCCISVSWEKECRPKQIAGIPIYVRTLQWRTVKLMTWLHCAYITFLGNFFNQVYFSFWVWFLVPRSFLFSSVYVFNRIFWGGYYRIFTAWLHWTKTLCTTYIKWESWWTWALKMPFVCVLYIWSFRLYFLLGYSVFHRCRTRTKSTLKNNFLLKNMFFQVKSLSKRLSWWVIIHVWHCVALLHLEI